MDDVYLNQWVKSNLANVPHTPGILYDQKVIKVLETGLQHKTISYHDVRNLGWSERNTKKLIGLLQQCQVLRKEANNTLSFVPSTLEEAIIKMKTAKEQITDLCDAFIS